MAPMRKQTHSAPRRTATSPAQLTKASSVPSNKRHGSRAASFTGLPARDEFFANCLQQLNAFLPLRSTPYETLPLETLATNCHEMKIRAACSLRSVKSSTFSKPGYFVTPEGSKGVACPICPEKPTKDLCNALQGPRKTFSIANTKAWRRHRRSNVHMDMMSLLLRVKRECLLDPLKCPLCSHTCAGQRSDALKRHVRLHHPQASWEVIRASFDAEDEPEDTELELDAPVATSSTQINVPPSPSSSSPFPLPASSIFDVAGTPITPITPYFDTPELSQSSLSFQSGTSSFSSSTDFSPFLEAALSPWFSLNTQSAPNDAPFSMQELELFALVANQNSYPCISPELSQEIQSILYDDPPASTVADDPSQYSLSSSSCANSDFSQLTIFDSPSSMYSDGQSSSQPLLLGQFDTSDALEAHAQGLSAIDAVSAFEFDFSQYFIL